MTISTQTRKRIAAGDGVSTSFNFTFQVRSAADLQIYYADSAGNLTGPLASNLYSVTLNPVPAGQIWSAGGNITYPLSGSAISVGAKLTIVRNVALLQSTSFINQGNYYPQSVEQAVDLLTMEMQQISEIAGRSLILPIDSSATTTLPSPIAGYALGWDTTGTFITNLAALGSIPVPVAVAQGGTGATTAATARAALGAAASGANTDIVSLAAPALGAATGTTQAATDSSTKIATTAMVQAAILASSIAVTGMVSNVAAAVASVATTIAYTADQIVVSTALNGNSMRLASYNKTLDTATTGAGGLDTGALAAGLLSIYAIAKADGTQNILGCPQATSSGEVYGGGNMPAGYTYSALIGMWLVNATPKLVVGTQRGRRVTFGAVNIFTNQTGSTTYASQSVSTAVPVNAKSVIGNIGGSTANPGKRDVVIAADAAGTGARHCIAGTGTSATTLDSFGCACPFEVPVLPSTPTTVFWKDSDSTASIYRLDIVGFVF